MSKNRFRSATSQVSGIDVIRCGENLLGMQELGSSYLATHSNMESTFRETAALPNDSKGAADVCACYHHSSAPPSDVEAAGLISEEASHVSRSIAHPSGECYTQPALPDVRWWRDANCADGICQKGLQDQVGPHAAPSSKIARSSPL